MRLRSLLLRSFTLPLVLGSLLASGALVAPASAAERAPKVQQAFLDRLVERAAVDNDVPGLVVRLYEPRSSMSSVAGVRQRGAAVAFRAGDAVHIGSALKAMTATIAARLVDRGAISWESTLVEIFPEQATVIDPALRTITLEELFAHRSGLTDDVPADLYERAVNFEGTGAEARALFLPEWLALPPQGDRGSFSYSNFGYALAGAMLERVTGKAYEDLVREELFLPLGMHSAQFGAPGSNDPLVIDAPRGHDFEGNPLLPAEQDDPPILAPAGTYSVTLRDWSKFARIHLGLRVGGELFLQPESLARLHTPVGGPLPDSFGDDGYALGWYTMDLQGTSLLVHDGSNGAWYSRILVNPRNQRVILQSCNEGSEAAAAALDQVALHPRVVRWLLAE
jgi:D-alanyl-D-alanine carboxypeptidase